MYKFNSTSPGSMADKEVEEFWTCSRGWLGWNQGEVKEATCTKKLHATRSERAERRSRVDTETRDSDHKQRDWRQVDDEHAEGQDHVHTDVTTRLRGQRTQGTRRASVRRDGDGRCSRSPRIDAPTTIGWWSLETDQYWMEREVEVKRAPRRREKECRGLVFKSA